MGKRGILSRVKSLYPRKSRAILCRIGLRCRPQRALRLRPTVDRRKQLLSLTSSTLFDIFLVDFCFLFYVARLG